MMSKGHAGQFGQIGLAGVGECRLRELLDDGVGLAVACWRGTRPTSPTAGLDGCGLGREVPTGLGVVPSLGTGDVHAAVMGSVARLSRSRRRQ